MLRFVFPVLAILTMSTTDPVLAQDRRVRIINETSATISEFYASNVGADNWEEDILGQGVLLPGESVLINVDDGTGYCRYDFRAIFNDGHASVRRNVNVCELASYRYYD